MTEEIKGYECPHCGRHHVFSVDIYIHCEIPITHTCVCGDTNTLQYGEVVDEQM